VSYELLFDSDSDFDFDFDFAFAFDFDFDFDFDSDFDFDFDFLFVGLIGPLPPLLAVYVSHIAENHIGAEGCIALSSSLVHLSHLKRTASRP